MVTRLLSPIIIGGDGQRTTVKVKEPVRPNAANWR